MIKFVAGLIAGVMLLGLVTHISRGQSAAVDIKGKEIKQGSILNMEVTVEKSPSVDGKIYVDVGPDGSTSQFTLVGNLNRDSTKCQVGERVPLDAKPGKWIVMKISFQPLASSPAKELNKRGESSFRVAANQDIVLPDSATISDIK